MRVLAWNRTPKTHPGVEFVPLEELLAESAVVSLHLALNDETRGFLDRRRIAAMLSDHAQRQNLLALAEDFQNQSEHAALLAQIALGKLMRAQSPG